MELVDVADSKSAGSDPVGVRFSPSAPKIKTPRFCRGVLFLLYSSQFFDFFPGLIDTGHLRIALF